MSQLRLLFHRYDKHALAFLRPQVQFFSNNATDLESITPNARYEKLLRSIVLDIWKKNYKSFDRDNEKLRRDIRKLEEERQKIFELHRSGAYSNEEFREQKAIVNRRITETHSMMRETLAEEFDMEEALDYCFAFVRNTAATWLRLEPKYDLRLRFQKLIFEPNVEFDGRKFGTTNLSTIYKLNQEYDGQESTLVALTGKSWNHILADLSQWHRFGCETKLCPSDSCSTDGVAQAA